MGRTKTKKTTLTPKQSRSLACAHEKSSDWAWSMRF